MTRALMGPGTVYGQPGSLAGRPLGGTRPTRPGDLSRVDLWYTHMRHRIKQAANARRAKRFTASQQGAGVEAVVASTTEKATKPAAAAVGLMERWSGLSRGGKWATGLGIGAIALGGLSMINRRRDDRYY